MRKLHLRLSVVIATFLLVAIPDIVTHHAPQAADAPGPYVLTDLGTLGGLSAQALDINEAGDIVGSATNAASRLRAFVWRNADGRISERSAGIIAKPSRSATQDTSSAGLKRRP